MTYVCGRVVCLFAACLRLDRRSSRLLSNADDKRALSCYGGARVTSRSRLGTRSVYSSVINIEMYVVPHSGIRSIPSCDNLKIIQRQRKPRDVQRKQQKAKRRRPARSRKVESTGKLKTAPPRHGPTHSHSDRIFVHHHAQPGRLTTRRLDTPNGASAVEPVSRTVMPNVEQRQATRPPPLPPFPSPIHDPRGCMSDQFHQSPHPRRRRRLPGSRATLTKPGKYEERKERAVTQRGANDHVDGDAKDK